MLTKNETIYCQCCERISFISDCLGVETKGREVILQECPEHGKELVGECPECHYKMYKRDIC